jgi:LAO/AO transport system kinase
MRTCADYAGALNLLRKRPQDPDGYPRAMTVSAMTHDGLDTAWDAMTALADWRREQGLWSATRAGQARAWFEEDLRQALLARLEQDPKIRALVSELGDRVAAGTTSPTAAATEVLAALDT